MFWRKDQIARIECLEQMLAEALAKNAVLREQRDRSESMLRFASRALHEHCCLVTRLESEVTQLRKEVHDALDT